MTMATPKPLLALLLLASSSAFVAAAPVQDPSSPPQSLSLLQAKGPSSPPSVVASSVRAIVGPLREDVSSRLDRVKALEQAETAPILATLDNLTSVLLDLSTQMQTAQQSLDQIPQRASSLIEQRESASSALYQSQTGLRGIKANGETRLRSLEAEAQEATSDDRILSGLLAFIQDTNAPEGVSNLAQIEAALQGLSVKSAPFTSDDPTTIRSHIESLVASAQERKTSAVTAHSALTTSLAEQVETMEGKIEAAQRSFDTALSQLEALEKERKKLQEIVASHAAERAAVGEAKEREQEELERARRFWRLERTQLSEMKATIEQVIMLVAA